MSVLVYPEYTFNPDGTIKSFSMFNAKRRPDLKNNPMPLDEMKQPGSLYDEFGNSRWRINNGIIVEIITQPTESQLAEKQINTTKLFQILKALMSEIDELRLYAGGESTVKYTTLKNILNKIQNGGI